MRFRKLRIAWSVFWGIACVLLIVLWVRSYSRQAVSIGSIAIENLRSSGIHVVLSNYLFRQTNFSGVNRQLASL
jgi:hypothetical protein